MTGPGRERGGAAILVAFMLVVLMAGAAFATSRNLTRELSMCADAVRGAKAASAAEAGLAWFLAAAPGLRDSGEGHPFPVPAGVLDEDDRAPLRQDFELRSWPLGALPWPGDAGPEAVRDGQLWLVRSVGRYSVRGQERQGFNQVRELLVQAPPEGDSGGLRILGWRTALLDP